MNPVLFLDIDGVLNSIEWQQRWENGLRDPLYDQLSEEHRTADRGLDPDAVARLSTIVRRTSCLVVLSSSWRKQWPLATVTRMLHRRGLECCRLFACTPTIWAPGRRSSCERGGEIDWWLRSLGVPVPFAIVDDDSDMEPHMSRLVQTDHQIGLLDEHVERLVQLLGESYVPAWGMCTSCGAGGGQQHKKNCNGDVLVAI